MMVSAEAKEDAMHVSNKEYRSELNRLVRNGNLTTRGYQDDEADDLLVPMSGRATKRYRRYVRADRDWMVIKRRSGF